MFAWRDNFVSYNGPTTNTDPYWSNVSLLMNFETPTTQLLDSSSNNFFPTTQTGSIKPSTFTPFTPSVGSSMYFTGGANYLTYPANVAFNLGTGNFTFECWIYMGSVATAYPVLSWGTGSYATFRILANGFNFEGAPTTSKVAAWPGGINITTNTWYHVALVRSNTTTVTAYLNGVAGTPQTIVSTVTYGDSVNTPSISYKSDPQYFNGFINNWRLVKGTAVYTSNFTPPTSPLTAISGTTMLLNGTNFGTISNNTGFYEISSSNLTYTATGTVAYAGASPFGNTYPGSLSVNGSAYLVATDSDGTYFTGDFTIEFWFYSTTTSATRTVVAQWPGVTATNCAWSCTIDSSNRLAFQYGIGATNATVTGTTQTFSPNTWNHVAYSRSGTTLRMFLNGVQDSTTGTLSGSLNNSTAGVNIGRQGDNTNFCTGNISNVRVLKGTALYTSNFTVPTTPLQAITNCTFLSRFEEGAFNDLSTNNLSYIQSTQAAYTNPVIKQFGTQSLRLAASSYLTVQNNTSQQFGTGDFTIELWVYRTVISGVYNIMYKGASAGSGGTGWSMQFNASNQLVWYGAGTALKTSTTTVGLNTWTFLTISRTGTTGYMFINGTLEGSSFTDSTNYNQTNSLIIAAASSPQLGYMDDIRITTGVCRYTASFSVPTQQFPTS